MICEINATCRDKFKEIENRLDVGDRIFTKHTTEIAVLHTNVDNLIKSLSGLTKALWAVCAATFATLLGFFIWYIQSI